MTKVGVLGSTGMLGTTLCRVLREEGFEVLEFSRRGISNSANQTSTEFVVNDSTSLKDLDVLAQCDVVVNALGLIKQVMDEDNEDCVLQAHLVNSYFPQLLNDFTVATNIPVIQIGTDCVFSGKEGNYTESSPHQYTDLYSFTKNVGEQLSFDTNLLRTSVIGCEQDSHFSLLSWVLSQKTSAEINGFSDHYWNGLTSFHFAKIVIGVIRTNNYRSGIRHVLPANIVSKESLVRSIAKHFDRDDLEIKSTESGNPINRSLSTNDFRENTKLWFDAGYEKPLNIEEMVAEYSIWEKNRHFKKQPAKYLS